MNTTKTMRLPPRRHLNRIEERDDFHAPTPKPPLLIKSDKLATFQPSSAPHSSNILLAGYMAHEYLTKGTLLGKPFDPARSELEPRKREPTKGAESQEKKQKRYAEVASLLRIDGARIQGIVNPTQLARFLNM